MRSFVENTVNEADGYFALFLSFFYEVGSVYFLVMDPMHHKQQLNSFVSLSVRRPFIQNKKNSVCQQL